METSNDPCDDAFAKFSRSFRAVFPRNLPKKKFGNDSFHRRDWFRQIFVQIGAILAIFRPFEVFGRFLALRVKIQIKRKLKQKWNQKRNGGRHLRGGASRPSRRFPRLRFWFHFCFNLRLIWISEKKGAAVTSPENVGKILTEILAEILAEIWPKFGRKIQNVAKFTKPPLTARLYA